MRAVGNFLLRLSRYIHRVERERREAYLAGAADGYELERRIRELDRPPRHLSSR